MLSTSAVAKVDCDRATEGSFRTCLGRRRCVSKTEISAKKFASNATAEEVAELQYSGGLAIRGSAMHATWNYSTVVHAERADPDAIDQGCDGFAR